MVTNSPVSSTSSSVSNPAQIRMQTEIEIPENTTRKKTDAHKTAGLIDTQPNGNLNPTILYFQNETEVDNIAAIRNHNSVGPQITTTSYKSTTSEYHMTEDETNNNSRCHHSKNGANNFNKLYFKLNLSNLNTRNNYVKTGLALLYAMIAMNFNLFILAIVHERVPRQTAPLPDLGFDIFPRVDWVLNISEYIIMAEFTMVIIMIILHKYRQLLLRRLCLIIGTLYIFRGVCMISTVFPVANDKYYCAPQMNRNETTTTGEFFAMFFFCFHYDP